MEAPKVCAARDSPNERSSRAVSSHVTVRSATGAWTCNLTAPIPIRHRKNHRLEKNNFGPLVKSNRYFFKLPKRILYRFNWAESVQKGCSNDFSFERYGQTGDRGGNKKIENRALMKVHLRYEKKSEGNPTSGGRDITPWKSLRDRPCS